MLFKRHGFFWYPSPPLVLIIFPPNHPLVWLSSKKKDLMERSHLGLSVPNYLTYRIMSSFVYLYLFPSPERWSFSPDCWTRHWSICIGVEWFYLNCFSIIKNSGFRNWNKNPINPRKSGRMIGWPYCPCFPDPIACKISPAPSLFLSLSLQLREDLK